MFECNFRAYCLSVAVHGGCIAFSGARLIEVFVTGIFELGYARIVFCRLPFFLGQLSSPLMIPYGFDSKV